jgi:histidinol dehydrogenase
MLNRLDLRGRTLGPDLSDRLPRPQIAGDEPRQAVRDILADVERRGDVALIELTGRLDGVSLESIEVAEADMDRAVSTLGSELRAAFDVSIARIDRFHRHQLRPSEVIDSSGLTIRAYQRPVRRAGLYVPGGRAEYPSTVLMTAVPARVAGVEEIVLCVPPSAEHNGIAPSVLAAARLAGVDRVFAVGGAQAIGAMAYGTETVPVVDVIAGPGNVYVALAKQEVAGRVGIAAAFAGPSEVVVVADETADPSYAAIDVIVQAEHGPDGLAWLVTWDDAVADAVCAAGNELLASSPRADDVRSTLNAGGFAVLVDNPAAAVAVIDAIAPEHLELQCRDAEALAATVNNAGAIFCGSHAPASLGDYVAGPSHVLPTFGSARFASALTVGDFLKDHHVVSVSPQGLRVLGPHVVAMARQEGLHAHAESIRLRLRDGQP